MCSGGSTGRPKLIVSTDDGRFDPHPFAAILGAEPSDTQLVTVPLTHSTGLIMTVIGLLLGQHVVLMSRFDPDRCMRLITDLRVDFMATVPTVLQRMLPVYRANREAYDLSSLRRLWHAGAPCPRQ